MITGSSSDFILAMKGELSHAFQMMILLAIFPNSTNLLAFLHSPRGVYKIEIKHKLHQTRE
jgi:hypothetical protein